MRVRTMLTVATASLLAAAGLSAVVSAAPIGSVLPDAAGLVDPATGIWRLRDPGGTVTAFYYGNPGDRPMLGDWDCDGVDTPGLYRQSDGYVYLRNSNTQGVADVRFFFGDPADIPLAGDWDGDGCDTVAVYRPGQGRMYVINELGSEEKGLGAADYAYYFGNPGDQPFVGDFDADGVDELGLHRTATGFVYMRMTHTAGVADEEFFYGDPGDRILAGDWTGDGVDTVAIYRPSDAAFHFSYANAAGVADHTLPWGRADWLPVGGGLGAALASGGTGLPDAYPGSAVPWPLVGDGWSLVLYNATIENPSVVIGPMVLYIVSPGGLRYEVGRWPAAAPGQPAPVRIEDWKPDGTHALVHAWPAAGFERQIWLLDLTTGAPPEVVAAVPELARVRAGFTRPTGANLVVYRNEGGEETLERRTAAGGWLATLAARPTGPPSERIMWLYDFDGDSVVIGDAVLHSVGIDGMPAAAFDSPGFGCDPVRWWSSTRFLAACHIEDPDSGGLWYQRLWLVPTDGSPASPLTAAPVAPPPVVDFGHGDAQRTQSGVLAQWLGDCGAGGVQRIVGGVGVPVTVDGSLGNNFLHGVDGDRMVVSTGPGCDTGANLLSVQLDGTDSIVLVPRADGARGVEDVVTLPEP